MMKKVVITFLRTLLQTAQLLLLAFRIDDDISISYWIVLLPTWLLITWSSIVPLFQSYLEKRKKSNTDEEEEKTMSLSAFLCSMLIVLIFLSPFFILGLRLTTGYFSSLYIVLPWFIVLGLFGLSVVLAVMCIKGPDGPTDADDEPPYTSVDGTV